MALNATFQVTGTSRYTAATDLSTSTDPLTIGTGNFDAIGVSLSDGTAADQSQKHWADERTVGAGLNDDIDLTSLTGAFGSLSFSRVTVVIIDIDSPDGTKTLNVGPQNVTNGWQCWFGGVTADFYTQEKQSLFRSNTKSATPGWAVSGTNKVLRINNPGAGSVTYRIYLAGV